MRQSGYAGGMTIKEQLHEAVDHLDEEQAAQALAMLGKLSQRPTYEQTTSKRRLPTFVGKGDSGRADISERVDEFLGEGFGR
jgi:hypothetical protein